MAQLGSHWTDFNENEYLKSFLNSVEEIQISLEPYKNNRHFT
jgi:hypothetical protein